MFQPPIDFFVPLTVSFINKKQDFFLIHLFVVSPLRPMKYRLPVLVGSGPIAPSTRIERYSIYFSQLMNEKMPFKYEHISTFYSVGLPLSLILLLFSLFGRANDTVWQGYFYLHTFSAHCFPIAGYAASKYMLFVSVEASYIIKST